MIYENVYLKRKLKSKEIIQTIIKIHINYKINFKYYYLKSLIYFHFFNCLWFVWRNRKVYLIKNNWYIWHIFYLKSYLFRLIFI